MTPRVILLLVLLTVLTGGWVVSRSSSTGKGIRPGPSDTGGALSEMASRGDWASVESLIKEGDDDQAIQALTLVAHRGNRAVTMLEKALDDDRPRVRGQAAIHLSRVGSRDQAPRIAGLIENDPVPAVRASAATALGRLHAFDQMQQLLDAMDDPDPGVRRRAGKAVERIAGIRYGFDALAARPARLAAIDKHRKDWDKLREKASEYWTKQSAER